MRGKQPTIFTLAFLVFQLTACVGSGPAQGTNAGEPSTGTRTTKTLTVVVLGEPTTFGEIGVSVATAGGDRHIRHIAHDYLTVENERHAWVPQLAAELISTERGTWRVNPDGTMDTAWKIRPNVKW